jgi:hypothetical protein
VQFYDEDTAALTHGIVGQKGPALVREAIARGYLDSARTARTGKPLSKDVGVVFIRKDPQEGLVHVKVGFSPEEYAESADSATSAPAAKKKK